MLAQRSEACNIDYNFGVARGEQYCENGEIHLDYLPIHSKPNSKSNPLAQGITNESKGLVVVTGKKERVL